ALEQPVVDIIKVDLLKTSGSYRTDLPEEFCWFYIAQFLKAAGFHQFQHGLQGVAMKVGHPHFLLCNIKALVKIGVLCCNAHRAATAITFQGLYAAKGEHHSPRTIHSV